MKRSVNEIGGLVLKAARGAGLDLGLAEDLAAASAHLDEAGLDYLTGAIRDRDRHSDLQSLCFAIDARRCGQAVDLPAAVVPLADALMAACSDKAAPPGPRNVANDLWAVLDDLAQATFVPATEASRLVGAGAGLDDND